MAHLLTGSNLKQAALLTAAVAGLLAAMAVAPVAGVALVGVATAIAATAYFRSHLPRLAGVLLGVILAGYAIGDRGFAHLGVSPVYLGEVVLAVMLTALLVAGKPGRLLIVPAALLLVAFQAVGLLATLPHLEQYGLDAMRDAALWGYGLFALAIVCLGDERSLEAGVKRYAALLPVFLLLTPVVMNLQRWAPGVIPQFGFSPLPILWLKAGDVSVHLGGVSAFMMLGLHRKGPRWLSSPTVEWILWGLWLVTFALVSDSRGGMLSVIIAMTTVFVLKARSGWGKPLAVVVVAVVLAAALQIKVDSGRERDISVADVFLRLQSAFQSTGVETVDITRVWRMNWWSDIVDYTIQGPYRWTGKGYGVNLADDDGYQTENDGSLRSPHSVHMTVLARSGVLGLAAWLGFLVTLAIGLFRVVRYSGPSAGSLAIWFLAYLAAFMVNASFDVYFEGPQGGIWLWTVAGAGMLLIAQERLRRARS